MFLLSYLSALNMQMLLTLKTENSTLISKILYLLLFCLCAPLKKDGVNGPLSRCTLYELLWKKIYIINALWMNFDSFELINDFNL